MLSNNPAGLDPAQDPALAAALGGLRYGLYFLTAGAPADPQGLLVSWVSQVSGRPPLILAAVRRNRAALPALEQSAAFALNLLPAGALDLLGRLARPAERRFNGLSLEKGPLGLPALTEGLGVLACRVKEIWWPGDHALLLGEVAGVVWWGGGPAMDAGVTGHAYLGLS